jgi:hypothetical protein
MMLPGFVALGLRAEEVGDFFASAELLRVVEGLLQRNLRRPRSVSSIGSPVGQMMQLFLRVRG